MNSLLFGAVPDSGRVVRDGNIITGGGLTAGSLAPGRSNVHLDRLSRALTRRVEKDGLAPREKAKYIAASQGFYADEKDPGKSA
jgi:hypothetical protein